jgi:hypothetical protein
MTTVSYAPPVDKLLSYGYPSKINNGDWPDYVAEFGFSAEHVPDLIRLATDMELSQALTESDEIWGPLHAWRVLGQLRDESAIEPLLQLVGQDDDWIMTELPEVYAMLGPAAIPPLTRRLADPTYPMLLERSHVAECFEAMVKAHPETRDACVKVLTQQLDIDEGGDDEPEFKGFLIKSLIEMKAVEAAPSIERAYAAELVDEIIVGDWYSVQVALGLKEEPENATLLDKLIRQSVYSPASEIVAPETMERPAVGLTAPVNRSSVRSQADKAKAKTKRKMEKESRKKNRKK